jgi:hypothetical protein
MDVKQGSELVGDDRVMMNGRVGKTGLPLDYDPNKDIQVYSGQQNMTMTDRTKKLCPSWVGGNNYWSASYSRRTRLLYIPS